MLLLLPPAYCCWHACLCLDFAVCCLFLLISAARCCLPACLPACLPGPAAAGTPAAAAAVASASEEPAVFCQEACTGLLFSGKSFLNVMVISLEWTCSSRMCEQGQLVASFEQLSDSPRPSAVTRPKLPLAFPSQHSISRCFLRT